MCLNINLHLSDLGRCFFSCTSWSCVSGILNTDSPWLWVTAPLQRFLLHLSTKAYRCSVESHLKLWALVSSWGSGVCDVGLSCWVVAAAQWLSLHSVLWSAGRPLTLSPKGAMLLSSDVLWVGNINTVLMHFLGGDPIVSWGESILLALALPCSFVY